MADEKIDRKYLTGLKFRGSAAKETKEDGRTKTRYVPFERALKPEDVLSYADKGAYIVIVTADGQKYTVDKGGEQ